MKIYIKNDYDQKTGADGTKWESGLIQQDIEKPESLSPRADGVMNI